MSTYPTLSIVFNRLNYKSKRDQYSVYLRIYHKGKTDWIRLDEIPKINKKDWVGKDRNWLRPDCEINIRINDKIDNILTEAIRFINTQILKGSAVTIQSVKDHFRNPEKLESFNNYAKSYLAGINKKKQKSEKLAYTTIQTYRSFLRKLDGFNPAIPFEQVNRELLEDFNDYLAGDCNLKKTSRAKHFDKFRVIVKSCVTKGLIKFQPDLFKGFSARNKPHHVKLSVDEIRKFKYTTLLDPTNEFYKNIFFFQLQSGLYYNDLKKLRISNFKKTTFEENGLKVEVNYLEDNRLKGEERFVIRLFKDAMRILKEYSNLKKGSEKDLLFPGIISNQKFNDRLKVIADCLDIDKNLTNRVGRHSFGTWMVAIGNSREKLGRTLGHTKDATTMIYSKLAPEDALRGWIEPEL